MSENSVKIQPPYQVPIFSQNGGMNPQWLSWFNAVSTGLSGTGGVDATQVIQIVNENFPSISEDFSTPPAPTGVKVTGGFSGIFIDWDQPQWTSPKFAHAEIYRSNSSSFNYAIPVGTAIVNTFMDTPPYSGMGHTYYYWVRFISTANVPGPFNAVAGTSGSTSPNPDYMLDLLNGALTTDQLNNTLNSRIDLIDVGTSSLTNRMGIAESDITTLTANMGSLTTSDFSTSISYSVGDLVKYGGSVYKCILATTPPSPVPTNTTYWTLIGAYASLADQVSANSSAIDNLDARVIDNTGDITAQATQITNLAAEVHDPSTGLSKAVADILQINNVSSSSTSASAAALYNVASKVNNPTTGLDSKATITELTTVDTTLLKSVATAINQTTTTLNGKTTTIEAISESVDGVSGSYTIKVDSNGYVAGFGLAVDGNHSTPVANFRMVADTFSIAPVATNPDLPDGSPFFCLTSPQVVGGVTLPAGTYLKTAYIGDATITSAKIGYIEADKIAAGNLNVAINMTAGSITGGTITGATIQTNSSVGTYAHGGIKMVGDTLFVYDDSGIVRVKIGKLS